MSKKPRGPAAPTDTPPKKKPGPVPDPNVPRTPSGARSRGKGIRNFGPDARSRHIGCRLTKADAEALEAAAKASGCTASEWVRGVVVAALRPVG